LGGKTIMYYVYVLQGRNDKFYKGSTTDLRKRYVDHNSGRVRSTKSARPWRLVYYEAFLDKKLARKEELFLKTGRGRERIKFLLNI
jgi:putative endonuclease